MTSELNLSLIAERAHWHETHVFELPARTARFVPVASLPSSDTVRRYLQRTHPRGIYLHQADAAACAADFRNFAVTTGTASGKTLCFHLAAMEALGASDESRVIALYPQKALGAEQEERWREALQAAQIPARVGRIDGQVPVTEREALLRDCRVIILTPDVMHAWLLNQLGRKVVRRFIRAVRLIIADEVHTFTGVFGSNAAYLLRRFEHASGMMTRKRLQYVCASATIADPGAHLRLLTGHDFTVIGPDRDGLAPPAGQRALPEAERAGTRPAERCGRPAAQSRAGPAEVPVLQRLPQADREPRGHHGALRRRGRGGAGR